jgi:hypothetical protein
LSSIVRRKDTPTQAADVEPPNTGTRMTGAEVVSGRRHQLGGDPLEEEQIRKQTNQFEDAVATNEAHRPIATARPAIGIMRAVAVKSPR